MRVSKRLCWRRNYAFPSKRRASSSFDSPGVHPPPSGNATSVTHNVHHPKRKPHPVLTGYVSLFAGYYSDGLSRTLCLMNSAQISINWLESFGRSSSTRLSDRSNGSCHEVFTTSPCFECTWPYLPIRTQLVKRRFIMNVKQLIAASLLATACSGIAAAAENNPLHPSYFWARRR